MKILKFKIWLLKKYYCNLLIYSTTPELPDFLKPTIKPTIRPLRPIDDIDLPDGSFVIQPGKEEEKETEEDKGKHLLITIFPFMHIVLIAILQHD